VALRLTGGALGRSSGPVGDYWETFASEVAFTALPPCDRDANRLSVGSGLLVLRTGEFRRTHLWRSPCVLSPQGLSSAESESRKSGGGLLPLGPRGCFPQAAHTVYASP
jgi:hypothetical protein